MTFAPGEICFAFHRASIRQGESPIDAIRDKGPKGGMSWRPAKGVNCGKRLLTISVFLMLKTGI